MNWELIISVVGITVSVIGSIIGWCIWVSLTLNKIQHSIKYTNTKLSLIDWDKVPRKNLNDII